MVSGTLGDTPPDAFIGFNKQKWLSIDLFFAMLIIGLKKKNKLNL
jgi:hypothetical protein